MQKLLGTIAATTLSIASLGCSERDPAPPYRELLNSEGYLDDKKYDVASMKCNEVPASKKPTNPWCVAVRKAYDCGVMERCTDK